jgi:hypothetical protein
MDNFSEFIGAAASRLARGLGLRPGEQEQLRLWRENLARHRAENQDRLDGLREEITLHEKRIRDKKAKYDKAVGLNQRLLAKEIQMDLRQLNRMETPGDFLLASIEANTLALEKLGELDLAIGRGVKGEDLDTIAVQLEEAFDRVEEANEALADLRKLKHKPAVFVPEIVDSDAREGPAGIEGPAHFSQEDLSLLRQLEPE